LYHATMLVLASHSPRRREILTQAGIEFVVRAAVVDETPLAGETPREHVLRLSRLKAEAVAAAPGEIVLGADTVVVAGGKLLGKPSSRQEAAWMLRQLSGTEHEVLTGVCLRTDSRLLQDTASTRVWFLRLSEEEIADYVATGEPMDKAGAYAIQGRASKFVEKIEGCFFNVVGLPVALVYNRLKELTTGGTL